MSYMEDLEKLSKERQLLRLKHGMYPVDPKIKKLDAELTKKIKLLSQLV